MIEIKLQALLNLTSRLVQVQHEFFDVTPVNMPTELVLVSKLKNRAVTEDPDTLRDTDMFIT